MDVLDVRDKLMDDHRSFTASFVDFADPRTEDYVNNQLDDGKQWPDPWLSLNPMFASEGRIDELLAEGLLHSECDRIFRVKRTSLNHGQRRWLRRRREDVGCVTFDDGGRHRASHGERLAVSRRER